MRKTAHQSEPTRVALFVACSFSQFSHSPLLLALHSRAPSSSLSRTLMHCLTRLNDSRHIMSSCVCVCMFERFSLCSLLISHLQDFSASPAHSHPLITSLPSLLARLRFVFLFHTAFFFGVFPWRAHADWKVDVLRNVCAGVCVLASKRELYRR